MITLNTDGGARGNPGPGALGIVLQDDGFVIKKIGKYLGICTNNEAEYKALILGLETAMPYSFTEITCNLDSELIVRQLRGEYKVKSPSLRVLYDEVKNLEKQFKRVSYNSVSRIRNKEADKLVNEVLDSTLNVK